jgi:hypothetical protein
MLLQGPHIAMIKKMASGSIWKEPGCSFDLAARRSIASTLFVREAIIV